MPRNSLEAIYCRDRDGLQRQLIAGSEALLGPRLENTKLFKDMYNYRSRWLHGDVDFPLFRRELPEPLGERSEGSDYILEMQSTTAVAVALLLATLQEFIERDWHDLEFHYSVAPA